MGGDWPLLQRSVEQIQVLAPKPLTQPTTSLAAAQSKWVSAPTAKNDMDVRELQSIQRVDCNLAMEQHHRLKR
jgi:hypothetical protein